MVESTEKSRTEEIVKKYNIDLEKLKKEQETLAKGLEIKDNPDLIIDKIGAVDNIFIKNKILSCIILCDRNFEILERVYSFEKAKFPYLPGFRNYREMPAIISAFEKLNEKPDLFFVTGQGTIHSRLGLANHFGLATRIPTIGVSNSIIDCEYKEEDNSEIKKQDKKVGRVLISKEKSNPLFISPGNLISVEKSYQLAKEFIKSPHKRPEPLHLVGKYCKKVKKELILN